MGDEEESWAEEVKAEMVDDLEAEDEEEGIGGEDGRGAVETVEDEVGSTGLPTPIPI